MATATRALLHRLVDELPEASVVPAAAYLERAADPMVAVLDAAPRDDEPLSPEERRQIEESERGIAEGAPLLTADELEAEIDAARA